MLHIINLLRTLLLRAVPQQALVYKDIDLCTHLRKVAGLREPDRALPQLKGAKPEGQEVQAHHQRLFQAV